LLRGHEGKWPRAKQHWEAVKARLKMTGHKEGVAIGGNISNRLFDVRFQG
jgi:hypothetical protein